MIDAEKLVDTELALEELGVKRQLAALEQKASFFKPSGVRTVNSLPPDDKGDVSLTTATIGAVPTTRTLTINGSAQDLSADRSWLDITSVPTFGGLILNETTTGLTAKVTGFNTTVPGTFINDSSDAIHEALIASNNNNFAYSGNVMRSILYNATDTGVNLKLENAGTGNYITADSVWSISKAGLLTIPNITLGSLTGILKATAGVISTTTAYVTSAQGTANQVLVNGTTGSAQTGAVTLTLPQSIGTGSSPTFTGLTVSGISNNRVIYSASGVLSGSANLTFNGSILTITGSGVAPSTTGLQVNGYSQLGVINSQTTPATNGNGGLGTLWNYNGGNADQAIFNQFATVTAGVFNAGFSFYQGSTTNNYDKMAWLKYRNGQTFFELTGDSSSALYLGTDWNIGRDGSAKSAAIGGRVGVVYGDWTSTTATNNAISSTINFNPASASSGRVWGLIFSATSSGASNLTDGNALTGLEGQANAGGSGTTTGITGGLIYAQNTGSGTVTTATGLLLQGISNSGGGTITNANFLTIAPYAPAYTANSQTRVGIYFSQGMPDPGVFTGTKTAVLYVDGATTSAKDGLNWNNDTIIYRSGTAALSITGSVTSSSAITATAGVNGTVGTFSTSVASPIYKSAAGVAMTVQPGAGTTNGAINTVAGGDAGGIGGNGAILKLRGGNGAGIGAKTGADVTLQGGTGLGGGANGTVKIFQSNGTTLQFQSNDTGLGLFAATPVGQYSTTGTVTGFTGTGGTAVTHSDTFTGNTGTTAYTIGDVVRALKLIGLMLA